MRNFLLLVLLGGLLTACGGGDSSPPPTNGTSDYAFFKSDTASGAVLKAYDPNAAPAVGVTTIPTITLDYVTGIIDGNIDVLKRSISNLRVGQVLFVDNAVFKSVDTDKSGALAVAQRSNYIFQGAICNPVLVNNLLIFSDSGPTYCGDKGNLGPFMISTGMTASDAPISLTQYPITILFSDFKTPMGMLTILNGNLVFADINENILKTLQMGVTSAIQVGGVGSTVLLNVDGVLKVFDGSSEVLSNANYAPTASLSSVVTDDTNFYLFDGSILLAVPINGQSNAIALKDLATTLTLKPRFVSNKLLVYSAQDSTTSYISKLDLSVPPYNITTLVPNIPTAVTSYAGHNGNKVYYNIASSGSNRSGDVAGMIDITTGLTKTNITAGWVGYDYQQSSTFSQPMILEAVVLDKYTLDGNGIQTGGEISVVDAATGQLKSTQGFLPPGITLFSQGFGFGGKIFGVYLDTGGSSFFAGMDASISNSMKRINSLSGQVTDTYIY